MSWPRWTGFTGKTLYEFVKDLGMPAALAFFGFGFALLQFYLAERSDQGREETARFVEGERARDSALVSYLDKMADLMLSARLGQPDAPDTVRRVARARTLSVLDQLDGRRSGLVVRFLHESRLITRESERPTLDLQGANLIGADLFQARLSGADLNGVLLADADLYEADLTQTNLSGANLQGAWLLAADLTNADLAGAYLANADLALANLTNVNLRDAYLDDADLGSANLTNADLRGASLRGADLTDAILTGVKWADTICPDGSFSSDSRDRTCSPTLDVRR